MSYEGSEEHLCASGHYYIHDCYAPQPDACPVCNAPWRYFHAIVETNGYDALDPATYNAAKVEVGAVDEWHVDHYGTKYATKTPLFAPEQDSAWVRIEPSTASGIETRSAGTV